MEGAFKYTYNNGQIAMVDTKATSMNFLNALERIPKLVEQYKVQNVTYERDIPILQETVGGVWRKEDELKALKAEVAALERKIQLTLAPPAPEAGQEQTDGVQQESERCEEQPNAARQSTDAGSDDFIRSHVHVVRPGISGETKTSSVRLKI